MPWGSAETLGRFYSVVGGSWPPLIYGEPLAFFPACAYMEEGWLWCGGGEDAPSEALPTPALVSTMLVNYD